MFKSIFGFDYDNLGGAPLQTQFVTGNGDIVDISGPPPVLPQIGVPTYSIGNYTPPYQFSNQSQLKPTAIGTISGAKTALIIVGLLGVGASLYLAGK